MQRPSASVVVLAWNAWDETRACLGSVLGTCADGDEVIVVDNGSLDGTAAGLASMPGLTVLTNAVNAGFAGGCNQGAAVAGGDVLVFLNSDTLVTGEWLDRLVAPFADPSIAASGPRSNFVSGPQLIDSVPYSTGDLAGQDRFARQWAAGHAGQRRDVDRLVGFCLAVRASAFASVGGFDTLFEGGGYEDDDLCRRLRQAGGRLVICDDAYVHHIGHASFDANGVDWAATELANRQRFLAKHAPTPAAAAGPGRPLVSLCMIVRDEEDLLSECIASATTLADEVVVYDTGSTDGTVALARGLGATVIEGFWDDDFARARNASLDHCHGQWILWLDADEVLSGDLGILRRRLSEGWDPTQGYVLRIENLMGNGLSSRTEHVACRLFRSDVGHWTGRLHEQVVQRGSGDQLEMMVLLPDAHIVHRGYLDSIYQSRHKSERNLRLAEAEVGDDSHDRPYALMNLGRSRVAAGRFSDAVGPLREAADSTDNPTVQRSSLRTLVDALLADGRPAEALDVALELRPLVSSPPMADIAEGRCRIALGEVEEGLRLLEQVRESGADEDGFGYSPHTLAAIRGGVLAALGRHGEAADLVLAAVRSEGALDLHVSQLCDWLLAAGRDVGEISSAVPEDSLRALAAQALHVAPDTADALLDGLAVRFPSALEPLAVAARTAHRLPVARALVWSARMRRAGLAFECPLVRIVEDGELDPRSRLRAAAAAYGSFGEQKVMAAARRITAEIGSEAMREEVQRISPLLADLLSRSSEREAELVALNLGCGGDRRPGYVNVDSRRGGADLVADVGAVPLADGCAREIMALDILQHLNVWQVPAVLAEWFRLLAGGGRLVLRVPNLEALGRRLVEAQAIEDVIRDIYGGHRFGPGGALDAHHTGWTPALLSEQLVRAGFSVQANDGQLQMTVVAERVPTEIRRPGTDPAAPSPRATIAIPLFNQAEATLRCLRSIASTEAGATFEVVLVDNGSTDATANLLEAVGGDVTVIRNATNLGFARACNQAAAVARSEVLVLLNNDTEVCDGWLARLLAVLDRHPETAAVGGRLLYPDGRIQHAGIRLCLDDPSGMLDGTLIQDEVGEVRLDTGVEAVTGACMAVRLDDYRAVGGLDEGFWNGNEDVDLCLSLRERGRLVAYEPACTVLHHESRSGPERWRRAAENRRRLHDRWAHLASSRQRRPRPVPAPRFPRPRRGGLNVVGCLEAALGRGELTRALVESAEAAGIPVSTAVSRLHPGSDTVTFARRGMPFEWDTNLVVATAEQYLRVAEEVGVDAFRDRYCIGMWLWELDVPSPAMADAAQLLHEIWVPNVFVAASVRQVVTDRPVTVVPVPLRTRVAPLKVARGDIAMPEGFVFASAIDFESGTARRNPVGLVRAFTRAFRDGEGPHLYLKTINRDADPAGWRALVEAIADRTDIVVTETVFDDERMRAVVALADCYVSMHRSVAAGRAMAEAMAEGVPVIATGYSGNLDFMDRSNSLLVPYELVPVGPGARRYPPAATWAEPDEDAAADLMRQVWEDPAAARRRAEPARAAIRARHNPEVCGLIMRERLDALAAARYGASAVALDRS